MIRAVICDDERAAHNIIQHFIEYDHLPVEIVGTAENGRDAWMLIKKENPDLIFMDINMPYMNGFEVIQKIRGSKVIIITAYDSFSHAQQALRLGACDIISKPIEFEQLRQAISRAIGWEFTPSETVNTILEYIGQNYAEKIELAELAKITFCTESHIARTFKKYMNMTVLSYVHKVRIEKSMEWIEEEKLPVKEAAEKAGYQNLNHFYKYFKQYTGMTPAMYAKQKRQE